jgi:hypothetical protein
MIPRKQMKNKKARAIPTGSGRASRDPWLAVFCGFVLTVFLFYQGFTALTGDPHEQRSAIQAAALAAARDISAIVIDDPNFGLIGLSDSPTVSNARASSNPYGPSVTGINTLLDVIRVHLIVADSLKNPIMTRQAIVDYNNCLAAQHHLLRALEAATSLNGTGVNANGTVLNPTQDAIDAYNYYSRQTIDGQKSSLISGSLRLSLGYAAHQPGLSQAQEPKSVVLPLHMPQSSLVKASNRVISYTATNTKATVAFVFADLSPDSEIVDCKSFQIDLQNLPYSTPTVIKVDADERQSKTSVTRLTADGQNVQTTTEVVTVHGSAAARAGKVVDLRPNAGALNTTFVLELTQFRCSLLLQAYVGQLVCLQRTFGGVKVSKTQG